jgi:hypothetical protein
MRRMLGGAITVPICTTAAAVRVASSPSCAGQSASADPAAVRSPRHWRRGSCVRPEPAIRSARSGADGAEDRHLDRRLQVTTPDGDVPAHLPELGAGAADNHSAPAAIGQTCDSEPAGRGTPRIAARRQAAVHLHPSRTGRRVSRLYTRPVGHPDARGRRMHILRERRAPRPVLRPLSRADLLLCLSATCGALARARSNPLKTARSRPPQRARSPCSL